MIDTIVQVFREYTSITYSSETAAEDAAFPESTFGYIPEGMVRNEDECMKDEFMKITAYKNPQDESSFTLYEELITFSNGGTHNIDTENATVSHFIIDGEEAISSYKDHTTVISWTHESIIYTLITYHLSPEDAKQIALNIHSK